MASRMQSDSSFPEFFVRFLKSELRRMCNVRLVREREKTAQGGKKVEIEIRSSGGRERRGKTVLGKGEDDRGPEGDEGGEEGSVAAGMAVWVIEGVVVP